MRMKVGFHLVFTFILNCYNFFGLKGYDSKLCNCHVSVHIHPHPLVEDYLSDKAKLEKRRKLSDLKLWAQWTPPDYFAHTKFLPRAYLPDTSTVEPIPCIFCYFICFTQI